MTSEAPDRIFMPLLWEVGDGTIPVPWQAEPDDVEYVRADLSPQWRPISEAPEGKDLLVCVTHNTGPDEWETVQWVDCFTDLYGWLYFPHLIWVPFPPTHFMPLPEAPK